MDKHVIRIINVKKIADRTGINYDRINNAIRYGTPENLKGFERRKIFEEASKGLQAFKNRLLL